MSPVRAMTLLSAAYNLGAVVGPISGGWIGARLGLRSVYLISAGIFLVSTVVLFFLRPQARDVHDPAAPPESLWKNTRFISFLGLIFLAMFVMYLPQPLAPRFLQNERGLSLESIGLLGSVGSLGNAVLALVLGQIAARSGFLLAEVSVAVFSLLLWKGTNLGWYAMGYFLLGGFRSTRSLIYAQVRPLIHPAQMGLAYGVAETASALAVMLAPLLAGLLYTQEPGRVYWVSAVLIGVMMILWWIFAPPDTGRQEQTVVILPPEG
jgi:predicted MFS family arabinose efflux permease